MAKLPSKMPKAEFMQEFGSIYEHSKWMAEQVYRHNLNGDDDIAKTLTKRFNTVFLQQDKEKQLGIINAHPDLAGKLAIDNKLTLHSTHEQHSAGLDLCSPEEFEKFTLLNKQYKQKFNFPFIKAVKGQTRETILTDFEDRINNSYKEEFNTALTEINKIAAFRLQDWFMPHQGINLASASEGAQVLYTTDDFFAAKERLIQADEAIFIEGKYDDHGKWMDGWESRRKRETGNDFCIIKLAKPSQINLIEIDTAFFTGNYAPCASIDACLGGLNPQADDTNWKQILAAVSLQGNKKHHYQIEDNCSYSHLKLNIYPDGGVARLRVYGELDD